jgi:hypothetical protein
MTKIILSIMINNEKKDITFDYNTEKEQQHYENQKNYYKKNHIKILQEYLVM